MPCGRKAIATLLTIGSLAACARSGDRPSFLLVVMDTTRQDAVSCYGAVAGTTPAVDELARTGLRYTRAYAAAPWTLPSHASLFTGLWPRRHGVGWRQLRTPDALPLLAERLRDRGYETVGFSENIWVGKFSGLDRGFEHFVLASPKGGQALHFDGPPLLDAFRKWIDGRRDRRPFFLFVNLMGAHRPLSVQEGFLPTGVDLTEAGTISQDAAGYNCNVGGNERALAILRGLYLAGVAENDRKLAAIRAELIDRGLGRDLVTIVTSDHGEHLGEHNLVDHQFSVREPLLRVPLIVHGKSRAGAVIAEPVSLVDLMPSVLAWAGAERPAGDGRELPVGRDASSSPRVLLAEYDALANDDTPYFGSMLRKLRGRCGKSDRVAGDMRAALRFPFKLLWFADGAAELYDVRDDPEEQRNLASSMPDVLSDLERAAAR